MTYAELISAVGVSKVTIIRWINSGWLPEPTQRRPQGKYHWPKCWTEKDAPLVLQRAKELKARDNVESWPEWVKKNRPRRRAGQTKAPIGHRRT